MSVIFSIYKEYFADLHFQIYLNAGELCCVRFFALHTLLEHCSFDLSIDIVFDIIIFQIQTVNVVYKKCRYKWNIVQ